jgi:hypothetical protein
MRSAAFVLALVLCTCTLAASAQIPPAGGAGLDKAAFLESLRTPGPVMAKSGLATKSACTVNLTCDVGGYPLSCSSSSGDCHAGPTWVECDGVRQNCPVCYRSKTCCDGSVIECWGWSSCSPGGIRNVVCDGMIQGTCPPISQCGP